MSTTPLEFCEWPQCRRLKGHEGAHKTSIELANELIAKHEQYIEELESKLSALQDELRDAKSKAIDFMMERDRYRNALELLRPGLELDLRYADHDDDIDALRSRAQTIREALSDE